MTKTPWRRRYHRILIQPRAQLRLFAPFFVFMLAWTAVVIIIAWAFHGMLEQISGPAQSLSADQIAKLQILSRKMFQVVMYGSLTAIVSSFLFWLKFSHNVFGPMVQIHRQIDKLKNGEMDQKIHLREKDEFQDVADSLNELTEKLKSKAG